MKYVCGACGQETTADSIFCQKCGADMRAVTKGIGILAQDRTPEQLDSIRLNVDSVMPSLVEHWRDLRAGTLAASVTGTASVYAELTADSVLVDPPVISKLPDVLLQAAVVRIGENVSEGQVVEGVAIAWFEIIAQLKRDPDFMFKIHWRTLEELIAGAYERDGFEVILTPRRGDKGRDVIATRRGIYQIRFVDQVKAYNLGCLVEADAVRSMLGVLSLDRNVSKGYVTTTSDFAPGIYKDADIKAFMPHRLELKNGVRLREWLLNLAPKQKKKC